MSLGLCLAGGGVKGAAHIGVLKALQEEEVSFEYLSGTSSGSIVAALYSVGYTPEEILELFKKSSKSISYIDARNIFRILWGIITKRKFIVEGLNSGVQIEKIVNKACKEKGYTNISELKENIIIPSVDLYSGEIYIFTPMKKRAPFLDDVKIINEIEIGKAVRASCSYPGVFSPVKYNGRYLIDGATRENTPWKELKNVGADKTLCISFENTPKQEKGSINIIDVISGALEIISYELGQYESFGADYLMQIESEKVKLLDHTKIDLFYELGYTNTKKNIEKIKELMYNT